jgi:tetratricopeptide (TPR) repeat protein
MAILAAMIAAGCGDTSATSSHSVRAERLRGEDPRSSVIRDLEEKVRVDPDDFVAYNKLASYYLQRLRETSSATYLELASHAARASLLAYPSNPGGLSALAQVQIASHRFAEAREQAERLLAQNSRSGQAHLILGDVALELGDEMRAESHFATAEQLDGPSIATRTRLARLALLRGKPELAAEQIGFALALANDDFTTAPETRAWCHWQLGEIAFSVGDYTGAVRPYEDALRILPEYPRALASRGRARAAQGDLAGAITDYERAIRGFPDPALVGELGDLYLLSGKDRAAAAQYALIERIVALSEPTGALYSRTLAVFHANHGMHLEKAYASAAREFAARADIYGADALAWTAFKAGRIAEASEAMPKALRLGTQDARLLYHAGMIARAAGDTAAARKYLRSALELSPRFDPLQAPIAQRTLERL